MNTLTWFSFEFVFNIVMSLCVVRFIVIVCGRVMILNLNFGFHPTKLMLI